MLNGASVVNLQYRTVYVDAGATAVDLVDGNLNAAITVVNLNQLAITNQTNGAVVVLQYRYVV